MNSDEIHSEESFPEGAEPWGYLSRHDETWIHTRFEWLIATFSLERLWETPFLTPCQRDFPDLFNHEGAEADAALLLSRICGYLDLDVNRIKLGFFSSDDPVECELAGIPSNAAGLYEYDQEKPKIWLDRSRLADAESVVATIAHELCHEILLGGGHLDADEDDDHEEVTDLLVIFLGFGVFQVNSCVREKTWSEGQLQYTENSIHGYLSMPVIAYAMALAAWYRNETHPTWLKPARPDARNLVSLHLKRLATTRGVPHQIPKSLYSKIGETMRLKPGEELDLPEIIVPEVYDTDEYTSVVKCVCPQCHKVLTFGIELAGDTVSCPFCGAYADVPELDGGRRETLVARWNDKRKNAAEQNWQCHNLTARWRNFFIVVFLHFGVIYFLVEGHYIQPEILIPYMFGALAASWMTSWWYRLKALEIGAAHQATLHDD